MPILSAVIATLGRTTELERFFQSVNIKNSDDIELIIADQNKNFLIDDLIKKYSGRFNIVHIKLAEANQSAARNYGAAIAKGSVICFPDDDCWFDEDTLDKVVNYFQVNPSTDLLIINWKQLPGHGVEPGVLTPARIYSFKAVGYATIVMYFKREKFQILGGFLETIGIGKYIGGGEDSELLFRAAKRKFSIFYASFIGINHLYIPILSRDLSTILVRQRAMGLMYFRYPIPYFVIFRGLISPFLKMLTSAHSRERQKHLQMGISRLQGFVYGYKNSKIIFNKG